MENNKISHGQSGEKSRLRELSTNETTKKKTENAIPAATKKATKFGLKLFNSTPKFPYIVKEIISLILPYM